MITKVTWIRVSGSGGVLEIPDGWEFVQAIGEPRMEDGDFVFLTVLREFPPAIITFDSNLNAEQAEKIRAKFKERHRPKNEAASE